MSSGFIARFNTFLLTTCGAVLLFGADDLLPVIVPGFPPDAAWVGQLLGTSWLALAAITWLTRDTPQGGIYGRPVVLANTALYFIATMVLVDRAMASGAVRLWAAGAVGALLALGYVRLLLGKPE